MTTSPLAEAAAFNAGHHAAQKAQNLAAAQLASSHVNGREAFRQRAHAFRHAADQIDRLLAMTPAELTLEQEHTLQFFANSVQFAF